MRPCLVFIAGIMMVLLSTACATRGIAPRVTSERVTIRGADDRPSRPADAPVGTTQARRRSLAKARSLVAGASSPGEAQAVGTRGLSDGGLPDADAVANVGVAATTGPSEKAASSPKRTATRDASMAGNGWLFALALAGAVACTVFYRRRLT
jgi:hypothetical protein